MDNAVFETLLRVADSDSSIRTSAENRLKELATQSGKILAYSLSLKIHIENILINRVSCQSC